MIMDKTDFFEHGFDHELVANGPMKNGSLADRLIATRPMTSSSMANGSLTNGLMTTRRGRVTGFLRSLAFLLVLLGSLINPNPSLLLAQDTGSGLDFLNIGPSSRILSLAEASTATLTGASAIYTNPALLAFESASGADVGYTLWIGEITNQFASVNVLKERFSYGFGVYNSGSGGFEARDRPGPSAGGFRISYLSLAAAGAYRVGDLAVGATGHYLREEVFAYRASGFAFTAGAALELVDDRVRFGAALQHVGEMNALDLASTTLPSSLRIGFKADLVEVRSKGLNDLPVLFTLHGDLNQHLNDLPRVDFTGESSEDPARFFSMAISANASDLITAQIGYRWGPTERPLSTGLGVYVKPVYVHYAFVPFSTGFGNVHSLGVRTHF